MSVRAQTTAHYQVADCNNSTVSVRAQTTAHYQAADCNNNTAISLWTEAILENQKHVLLKATVSREKLLD